MRLIDADELVRILEERKCGNEIEEKLIEAFIEIIDTIPTVDAVPVVQCKDCDLLQGCKYAQYLGLDGYCSNADMRKKVE